MKRGLSKTKTTTAPFNSVYLVSCRSDNTCLWLCLKDSTLNLKYSYKINIFFIKKTKRVRMRRNKKTDVTIHNPNPHVLPFWTNQGLFLFTKEFTDITDTTVTEFQSITSYFSSFRQSIWTLNRTWNLELSDLQTESFLMESF